MSEIKLNKPVQAKRVPTAVTGLIYTSTKQERLWIKEGEEARDIPEADYNRFLAIGALEEKLVEV